MRTKAVSHNQQRGSKGLLTGTDDSGMRSDLKYLAFMLILVAGFAPAVLATSDSLWPLVKHTHGGVWGTLTEIRAGETDRLLVIDVMQDADGRMMRGVVQLLLLDRAGLHPEGTPLHPGATGLFFFCQPRDASGDFAAVDGWFVPGGFAAILPGARERLAIGNLLEEARQAEPQVEAPALELLDSPDATCRALALGSLLEHGQRLDLKAKTRLADAFARESQVQVQRAFLKLFLLHGWPLAGDGAVPLLLHSDDPELLELTLRYLAEHAEVRHKALLLEAYPRVERKRRPLLLRAY
ncbi:MAG: hypothetical protein V3T77_09045, partial [Planctomycetota bacterium]